MSDNIQPKKIDMSDWKPSPIKAWLAALFSVFVPGLGQVLSREIRRGLLLFAGFMTSVGILIWRLKLAAPRDVGWENIIKKAYHLQPFLIGVTILVILLYIFTVIDAYLIAKRKSPSNPFWVFVIMLVAFFSFGWQIGEIDLVEMITQSDDAWPALTKVLWPWEKAISYPEEVQVGKVQILAPCAETPFPEGLPREDEPYLIASPTCGNPSEQGGEAGTEFTVMGYGFDPNLPAEIWWEDPIGNEFRQRQGGEYVIVDTDENGEFSVDIIMPYRLLPPSAGEGSKEWTIQARQVTAVGAPVASEELMLAIEKIIETIFIGMMATFFGIILALPLSFLAARNLMSVNPVTLGIYYIVRTIMNIVRSIEPLIWAIIAVLVVGLGPFAGILALTLHSMAALAKLYSESIESIDPGPIEAIQATGANWFQTVMYAVVPQIIPPFVSFTIYRWDINIRMSTIIGFVGGGGIGFLLAQWIRLLDYKSAGIAVWFIAITVAVLDYVSAEIRQRFI
jgi:phosphonate transport system permease protein